MTKKFESLIALGQKSSNTSSVFDVALAQLVATIMLNKDKGLDFQFVKDGDSLKLEIIDELAGDNELNAVDINLATRLLGVYQLTSATSKVSHTLKRRGLEIKMNSDNSLLDQLLMASLSSYYKLYEQANATVNGNRISSFEDNVAKKLIQLNTFRKMFSDGGKNVSASSERALALSIIAINYFLDADRFSADKTSEEMSDDLFFKKVGDLEFLDKVLVMGLQDNYDLTNFMCGRSRGGDRATGYLSAYNLNSYNSSPNYGSNSVRIDDIAIQMIEKTDYMI